MYIIVINNEFMQHILFCFIIIRSDNFCIKKYSKYDDKLNLQLMQWLAVCVDSDVDVKDLNSGYANISLTVILPKIVSFQETLSIQKLYKKLTLLVPY